MELYDVARVDGTERSQLGHPAHSDVKLAANVAKRKAMDSDPRGRWVVLVRGTDLVAAVCWPDGGADFQAKPYPTR